MCSAAAHRSPIEGGASPADAGQLVREAGLRDETVFQRRAPAAFRQPAFKPGFRFIGSHVFNRNVEFLSDYLTATRAK